MALSRASPRWRGLVNKQSGLWRWSVKKNYLNEYFQLCLEAWDHRNEQDRSGSLSPGDLVWWG